MRYHHLAMMGCVSWSLWFPAMYSSRHLWVADQVF
jgi:hypothetical protein